jgi:hypothetical protein
MTQTTKTLNGEHVRAMVTALEAAGIHVKRGELGGYFVKARSKTTGERKTPFSAILIKPDTLRIPTKPAPHSERKPATCSDLKPAGIPI